VRGGEEAREGRCEGSKRGGGEDKEIRLSGYY